MKAENNLTCGYLFELKYDLTINSNTKMENLQSEGLKRELGILDVATNVVNISIASGIFLLPAIIILAWLLIQPALNEIISTGIMMAIFSVINMLRHFIVKRNLQAPTLTVKN